MVVSFQSDGLSSVTLWWLGTAQHSLLREDQAYGNAASSVVVSAPARRTVLKCIGARRSQRDSQTTAVSPRNWQEDSAVHEYHLPGRAELEPNHFVLGPRID